VSEYSALIRCRLCLGGTKKVLSLTPTPIANSFPKHPDLFAMRYPLELVECGSCGHVQIGHEIRGEALFDGYKYETPQAERGRLAEYAAKLAAMFPKALRSPGGSKNYAEGMARVLEIGSNNGIFVEELNRAGLWAVGVDPSPAAPLTGMPRWFTSKTAKQIAYSMGKMELILANNTFAHVDDLRNVFSGIDSLLSADGSVIFEVQYLPDMVAGGMFDMIYHEHKDYHSLAPFRKFLKKFGMCVYKFEHLPTHGGSIRVYVRRGLDGITLSDPAIDWEAFSAKINAEGERLRKEVIAVGKVAAFGATAKACTLIHHFGLAEHIEYFIDETPAKQGCYIPGTTIPVLPKMEAELPVLLTAWNYAELLRPRFKQVIVPFDREERKAA